jgi:type IV secretion system protein VirB11
MNSLGTNVAAYDKSITVREKLKQTGIQQFLDDPAYTEIAVSYPGTVFTASPAGWTKHKVPQCTLQLLRELANAASIYHGGTALDMRAPIKKVRLPDNQRGLIVVPPACIDGTVSLTFRVGFDHRFSIDSFIETGRLGGFKDFSMFKQVPDDVHLLDFELELIALKEARDMKRFFQRCIENELSIGISGKTGSGKTAFMKALADLVPPETRIITIEDVHELDLPLHENKLHLFYGDFVTPKDTLAACMRAKPDRIFVTELKGDEAFDYIASLNTGHSGSITTVHANNPLSAYHRVATLIKQSPVGLSLAWDNVVREVTTSIDVMIQFSRTRMTGLYYDPVRRAKIMRGDHDV